MIYLDSSAIVKRYISEPGSEEVIEIYRRALNGELSLSFSAWNIGEVLGVFDKYFKRGWLSREDYERARKQFLGETMRLLRLKVLNIVPVKVKLLTLTWPLIEKYHVYEVDALQVVSADFVKAQRLYTGDELVHKLAVKKGLKSVYLS